MAAKAKLGLRNLDIATFDFEKFLATMRGIYARKVVIYFYDASHNYRSQMLALQHASKYIALGGIIVVDDCNYPHVRQATADMLAVFPEFKLLFEAYTGTHPATRQGADQDEILRTWWDGVNVIIHSRGAPTRLAELFWASN
jgi:hypothetical protein